MRRRKRTMIWLTIPQKQQESQMGGHWGSWNEGQRSAGHCSPHWHPHVQCVNAVWAAVLPGLPDDHRCCTGTLPSNTGLVRVLRQPSLCLSSCGICKVLNPSISFCHLQSKNMKCNRQTAGYSVELCLPSGLRVLASSQDPSTCDISDSFNKTVLKTMLIKLSQLPEKFILLV